MSEDISFLPRLIIKRRKNFGSFHINFKVGIPEAETDNDSVKNLIALAEDWTAYCIASLEFIPGMASAGFFWVEQSLTVEDINFFREISISNEDVNDDTTGETTSSFIFHEEDLSEVAKKMATNSQMLRAAKTVQRSTLSSLISEFDFFLARFLRLVSDLEPEKFYDPADKVSVGELSKFASFSDLLRERIGQSISTKLRGSHADVLSWIFKEFDLEKSPGSHAESQVYKDFLEVCQRRHLMAHNGGIVNEEYLRKCKLAGWKDDDLDNLGDLIAVNANYLKRATGRVFLVGYFMLQMFLQKKFPKSKITAYTSMLSASHSFLERDLTKMALRICDFAEVRKKEFDQSMALKFGVNRALTYLFDPGLSPEDQRNKAISVLDKYDWSVTTPVFDLALACIRRDFSDLIPLARAAAASGLTYADVRTFVVFREAREMDGFLDCFPRAALAITAQ